MKKLNKKRMVAAIGFAIFFSQTIFAGDVEISLPTATDAFTVDQPAGTELMRVHGDGNVGIGTTTPTEKLSVFGNAMLTGELSLNSQRLVSNGDYVLSFLSNHDTLTRLIMKDKQGAVYGSLSGTTDGERFGLLDADGDWSYLANKDTSTQLKINSNTIMHLDAAGNVGIGTTIPDENFVVMGDKVKIRMGSDSLDMTALATATSDYPYIDFIGKDGTRGAIFGGGSDKAYTQIVLNSIDLGISGGNVGIGTNSPDAPLHVIGNAHVTGTLTQDSDERLKTKITPLNDSLNKLAQLQGVNFKWKDEKRRGGDVQVGLIAQDVKKVFPELVTLTGDEQKTLSVNYIGLISVLN